MFFVVVARRSYAREKPKPIKEYIGPKYFLSVVCFNLLNPVCFSEAFPCSPRFSCASLCVSADSTDPHGASADGSAGRPQELYTTKLDPNAIPANKRAEAAMPLMSRRKDNEKQRKITKNKEKSGKTMKNNEK